MQHGVTDADADAHLLRAGTQGSETRCENRDEGRDKVRDKAMCGDDMVR